MSTLDQERRHLGPGLPGRHRGYLFDLDGTLVDTAPDLHQAQNATLHEFGLAPEPLAATRRWVGHGARRLLERAAAHQGRADAPLEAMLAWFLDYYRAHIAEHSRPYPGVIDTLERLRDDGARLAVVTNKKADLSSLLLQTLEMSPLFDVLVGGDSAALPKPDAAPAALACAQLQLAATDVLFVGDSTTDVGCARAFGCAVVCVPYGYRAEPLADLGADAIIGSLTELL